MISVVLATCNGEKYIKQQLYSILFQTLTPNEIIIVDDASDDNTVCIIKEILKKYEGTSNVKLYVNQERKGYIDNFFYAIELAKGDTIYLSDQDDIWIDNKIEVVESILNTRKEVYVLGSSYGLIDENGNKIVRLSSIIQLLKRTQNINWESFIKAPRMPGMSMTIRGTWYRENKECFNNKLSHDWQLAQLAASMQGLFYYRRKLVLYRQHKDNLSGGVFKVNTAIQNNISNICSLAKKNEIALEIYRSDPVKKKFLVSMKSFLYKRKCILESGNMKDLVVTYILNRKYYPIHNFMCDIYCILMFQKKG